MIRTKCYDTNKNGILLCYLAFFIPFPVLAFVFAWIIFIKNPSQWRRGLILYTYAIFIIAYSYEATGRFSSDLLRYFAQLEQLQYLSPREAISYMNNGLITENLFFWFIAHLQLPHLLPAITTATVYGVGAYIVFDTASKSDRRNSWKIILIQLMIIPLINIITNVRNVFAFSVIVLGAYLELDKNKKWPISILLYLLAVFMHKSAAILVVLRLLVPVFKNKKFTLIGLVLIFSLPVFINFAYSHISFFSIGGQLGVVIRRLILSSHNYLLGVEASGSLGEYALKVQNSAGGLIARVIIFTFVGLILFLYIRLFFVDKMSPFEIFAYLVFIVCLSCNAIDTPVYWRFGAAGCLAMGSVLYQLFKGKLFNTYISFVLRVSLYILSFLRLLLLLYQTREYDYSLMAGNVILTNAYSIIFKIIRSLLKI